jgi:thiol:disulfide interchange protein
MSKSPWIIALIFIVWLAVTQSPETSISSQKAIQWKTFETGMSEAQAKGKPMFLHFYAVWCAYCTRMEKESFQDDTVIDFLNQNYISIRIDIDKHPEITKNYNVFAVPTTYFFSAKGEKMGPVPGYISKERLLDMLSKV